MRRLLSIILISSMTAVFLMTGCSSKNGANDAEAVITDELSSLNTGVSKNLDGEIIFYPAFEDKYKTANNEKFDFWFDIPVQWNAVDRSEDGSEFFILPGNYKADIRIFGLLMDGSADEFYRELAGKEGEISDFIFRDTWVGKKIVVSESETYYVRVDGDSYLILHIDSSKDPEWKTKNEDAINYIAMSARTTRESFGRMTDEICAINAEDLKLGNIKVGMTCEKLIRAIGQDPAEISEEDYDGMNTKMLYFPDDTQVYIVNDIVFTINVTDPAYATPRGLRAGDSEERIIELYGEPNKKEDGIWGYNINGYELLTIVVTEGRVSQIQIEHGVWNTEVF